MIHSKGMGTAEAGIPINQIAQAIDAAAAAEEQGSADIARSVALLRQAGWLADTGATDPKLTVGRLQRVGAANLPVGRLWEGHINALYLAQVHGDAADFAKVMALVSQGALLGVWGADGAAAVHPVPGGDTLTGQKAFASGLGCVTHAIVTVSSGPQVRLGLVDVRDMARADKSVWRMQGMRATASGHFSFDGIALRDVLWLGNPGDYLVEPHFIGGVWRIGALQVGGALGLLDAAARDLRARGRLDAPAQMARLSSVAIAALGASALVQRAACGAAPGSALSAERSAALSAAARLLGESVGLDAIRAVEQCMGLPHFEEGSVTGRKARDLAVYMRQAARDAFQTRVGDSCFGTEGDLWTLF
jgi:hypothetical protein